MDQHCGYEHAAYNRNTVSPPNMGHISERSREHTEAQPERYVSAWTIARPVVKLLGETRLKVGDVVGVIHCGSLKRLLTDILSL